MDSLAALISTSRGTVSPRPVENALGELDAVDLVACYPVHDQDTGVASAAAVTLRPGAQLDAASLNRALAELEPDARPDVIHVLEEMPVTSWFRPSVSDLRPPPETGADAPAWQLNRRTRRYQAWPPSAATSPVAMGNEQDR